MGVGGEGGRGVGGGHLVTRLTAGLTFVRCPEGKSGESGGCVDG